MEIQARIERIQFYNEESGYSILVCKDETERFTVVGNMITPLRGQEYIFNGSWGNHPKYGRQFQITESKMLDPKNKKGIEEFLSSGIVYGIGKVMAKRIVSTFGEDTFRIFDEEPERLRDIKGVGKKTYQNILDGWREAQEKKEVVEFLQGYGASIALAKRVYKQYGNAAIDVIKDNPYILVDDVWGIGFKTADDIAREMGIPLDDPNRIKSGITSYLKSKANSGHCFEYYEPLVKEVSRKLYVRPEVLMERLDKMAAEEDGVIAETDAVYLKSYYYAEYGIAKKLFEINQFKGNRAYADIDYLEERFDIAYDETQIDAIRDSLNNKVSIITGGPGTGKTTIIKAIAQSFQDFDMKVVLASPTGRAAKRMSEVVGMEAKTIHRLLEYNPKGEFGRNEDNPIEGDVLILDECSMIDELLMYSLLKAIEPSMNLVMVGDIDQLPSVGPGNVLADIINSECFYVAKLTKVFRQAEESDIVMNAHRINHGETLVIRDRDVRFVKTNNINDTIVKIVTNIDKRGFTPADVQVLSPMKKTMTGTNELNNVLQAALNKNEKVVERKGFEYRIGDRVMQIRNNYDKEIFNGSLGVITGFEEDANKTLIVDFDGMTVEYDSSEFDELMLAYAITVHKSQGSEFPVVIIPMSKEHGVMLQRNLLYTAFTRPSKMLYLVGDTDAFYMALENNTITERRTRLIDKIKGWCN